LLFKRVNSKGIPAFSLACAKWLTTKTFLGYVDMRKS
jgi:hypothetical protein